MKEKNDNNIFSYLMTRKFQILLLLLTAFIFGLIQFLYSETSEAVFYSLELCAVFYLLFGMVDFIRYRKKHRTLLRHLQMQHIYAFEMETASDLVEREYQQMIERLIDNQAAAADCHTRAMTELKDYYAVWAHQIKTPISALNLLLQVMAEQPGAVCAADLRQEVFKIDFYADAVMNYLRLEDLSADFKFERYSLDEIVKKAVRKFASQFIHKKISVQLAALNTAVYTDERWLGFIVEQLLSNAIKYTERGGCVQIRMECEQVLSISDNGIGISREDLPRIMERGFTGYNGRMDKKSSGIGLYLCGKAAHKLGCTLTYDSQPGQGTKVCIDMTQNHVLHE